MTLTLTMKISRREVKQRRAALKASGHSKADVRRRARVAERTVYYWYAGQKSSPKVAAAHATLTAVANEPHTQNGRPERSTARTA